MGKTKRLAEELTEKERQEKPLEPAQDTTRMVKMRGLTSDQLDQLVAYLDTRPHGEIKSILAMLGQTYILTVEVKEVKAEDAK